MNWQKIKEEHPKGFHLFCQWIDKVEWIDFSHVIQLEIDDEDSILNPRMLRSCLYDFFDMHQIFICVHRNSASGKFEYRVEDKYQQGGFNTRSQGEFQGFVTAFGILENKL